MSYENECHFVWKIENFSVCITQNREYILSPIFQSKVVNSVPWRLCIGFAGKDSEEESYLTLSFQAVELCIVKNIPDVVFFDVGLANASGGTSYNHRNTIELTKVEYAIVSKFAERSAVIGEDSEFLLRDVLTVKGRVWKLSPRRATPERFVLRSTLRMEEVKVRFTINPQVNIQSFTISSESVPEGYKLTCIRFELKRVVFYDQIAPPNISIEPLNGNNTWTFMTAKITLVGRLYEPVCQTQGSYHFGIEFESPWVLPIFKGPFDQFGYFHSNRMELDCEFTISNYKKESSINSMHYHMNNFLEEKAFDSRNILVNDMRPFLHDPTFSDIQVLVGKVRIPAHQVVLSARSQIFHELLKIGLKNQKSSCSKWMQRLVHIPRRCSDPNQPTPLERYINDLVRESGVSLCRLNGRLSIVFSDVEERIVRIIVSFLYTDDLGCVDHDTAIELMRKSQLYRIPGLFMYMCHMLLKANTITIENSIRTLAASWEMWDILAKKTLSFINGNIECVLFHLDRLGADHEDTKVAKQFGLVRGEFRNKRLFPSDCFGFNLF